MQQALGLMDEQALMFSITIALGIAGVSALAFALFLPRRLHLPYRLEVFFVVLLAGIVVFADARSASTYRDYEKDLPEAAELSGEAASDPDPDAFDRQIRVYAFQWGFVFLDEKGRASRNAVSLDPGQKVLFRIMSNDVIHGFNVPAARITTEFDPGAVRSIWLRTPQKPGKYLIQCVNYCGLGHAQMKAWLVVGEA